MLRQRGIFHDWDTTPTSSFCNTCSLLRGIGHSVIEAAVVGGAEGGAEVEGPLGDAVASDVADADAGGTARGEGAGEEGEAFHGAAAVFGELGAFAQEEEGFAEAFGVSGEGLGETGLAVEEGEVVGGGGLAGAGDEGDEGHVVAVVAIGDAVDGLDDGFGGGGEGIAFAEEEVAGADGVAWGDGDDGWGDADEKGEVVGGGDAGAGEAGEEEDVAALDGPLEGEEGGDADVGFRGEAGGDVAFAGNGVRTDGSAGKVKGLVVGAVDAFAAEGGADDDRATGSDRLAEEGVEADVDAVEPGEFAFLGDDDGSGGVEEKSGLVFI